MSEKAWFENDDLFRDQLRVGHDWQDFVAKQMRRCDLDVTVTPIAWRQSLAERQAFADEVDLIVNGARVPIYVDVKSRALTFRTPQDYPYPTAFVYSVRGWEAKTHKPSAIVLVSQRTGAMLVVPRSSKDKWEQNCKYDHTRGISDSFYTIDRNLLVPMSEFINWLWIQTGYIPKP